MKNFSIKEKIVVVILLVVLATMSLFVILGVFASGSSHPLSSLFTLFFVVGYWEMIIREIFAKEPYDV